MIVSLFINIILAIFGTLFSFLPVVSLATIPVIGETIRELLITVVQMWNAFIITFPYAEIAWLNFLVIILPFEILMLVAKFFLGSRTPSQNV